MIELIVVKKYDTFFATMRSDADNLMLVKAPFDMLTLPIVSKRIAGDVVRVELAITNESSPTI